MDKVRITHIVHCTHIVRISLTVVVVNVNVRGITDNEVYPNFR